MIDSSNIMLLVFGFLLINSTPLIFAEEYPRIVESTDRYIITQVDESTFVFRTVPCENCGNEYISFDVSTMTEREYFEWDIESDVDHATINDVRKLEKQSEFGVIATWILVIAIISIIIVSLKINTGVIPRY